MKIINIFTIFIALNLTYAQETAQKTFPKIANLIPSKSMTVDVMGVKLPKEAEELSLKFHKGIKKKAEWWIEYVERHAEERPLPYHKNFGITKKEYERMLDLSKNARLSKIDETQFKIQVKEEGYRRVLIAKMPKEFSYIDFFSDDYKCRTPLGVISKFKKEELTEGVTIGLWKGYSWHTEIGTLDEGEFKSITITLGRIMKSGKNFLSYRQTLVEEFDLKVKNEFAFVFEN